MAHVCAPVSIAGLLDDVRPLISRARAAGETPRFLLLPGDVFDAVHALKSADVGRGVPVMVLGMEIVRSDDPGAPPRVF